MATADEVMVALQRALKKEEEAKEKRRIIREDLKEAWIEVEHLQQELNQERLNFETA